MMGGTSLHLASLVGMSAARFARLLVVPDGPGRSDNRLTCGGSGGGALDGGQTCGNDGQVVKVFAALNIEMEDLKKGLTIATFLFPYIKMYFYQ